MANWRVAARRAARQLGLQPRDARGRFVSPVLAVACIVDYVQRVSDIVHRNWETFADENTVLADLRLMPSRWIREMRAEVEAARREGRELALFSKKRPIAPMPPTQKPTRKCGRCHTCGTPLRSVLDGEEWCPKCSAYRRYRTHGWGGLDADDSPCGRAT